MQREDVMRKVQALMDRAESTTFEPERDACLAKADSLMAAYSIEQFELEFAKPAGSRQKPEVRVFTMAYVEDYQISYIQRALFMDFARHTGCLVAGQLKGNAHNEYTVIGFPDDLNWLDWLFTSVRLNMMNTMVPKPNRDMTLEENIVLLKETGLKWQDIYTKLLPVFHDHPRFQKGKRKEGTEMSWDVVIGGDHFPETVPRPFGVWCTGVYTKHCEKHGLPRNYASPDVYRRSFIEGYVGTIRVRLREMAAARGEAAVGKGLVLANKEGDLKDLLYELRPELRPHPADCDCDPCHRGKCRNRECKRPVCVAARKPVKYSAGRYRELKYDAGAARNGSRAAKTADLMGGRNNVGSNKRALD